MAVRGAKPKPAALRLITARHDVSRHGSKAAAATLVEQAETSFGPLVKPEELHGDASKAWDKWIAPAERTRPTSDLP